MYHPNQIYEQLQECSYLHKFMKTVYLPEKISPWEEKSQQTQHQKNKFPKKRPQTASVFHSKSKHRCVSQIRQKKHLNTLSLFMQVNVPVQTPKSLLTKTRFSTPLIKQKRKICSSTRYSIQYQKPNKLLFKNIQKQQDKINLFFFKPTKRANPIQLRNKNIHLIRHLPIKRFFKDTQHKSRVI